MGRPRKWASDAERMAAKRGAVTEQVNEQNVNEQKSAPGFCTPGHIACCPCKECLARRGFEAPESKEPSSWYEETPEGRMIVWRAPSGNVLRWKATELPVVEIPADSPRWMLTSLICRPQEITWIDKKHDQDAPLALGNDRFRVAGRIKADVLERAK